MKMGRMRKMSRVVPPSSLHRMAAKLNDSADDIHAQSSTQAALGAEMALRLTASVLREEGEKLIRAAEARLDGSAPPQDPTPSPETPVEKKAATESMVATMRGRIDKLAVEGEISGQIAYYLKEGRWPEEDL
jgi:hypothetical protein